jgi:hypothetical protein
MSGSRRSEAWAHPDVFLDWALGSRTGYIDQFSVRVGVARGPSPISTGSVSRTGAPYAYDGAPTAVGTSSENCSNDCELLVRAPATVRGGNLNRNRDVVG